ncbi:MAG: hypothetical protein Q9219_004396 [cf. Caloplaca sp. 3 TL-2023]
MSTQSAIPAASSQLPITSAVPTALGSDSQRPSTPARKNDLGTKLGAGIGIPAGVLLIAAVIYFMWARSRQRRKNEEGTLQRHQMGPEAFEYYNTDSSGKPWPQELGVNTPSRPYEKAELSDDFRKQVSELSGKPEVSDDRRRQVSELPSH